MKTEAEIKATLTKIEDCLYCGLFSGVNTEAIDLVKKTLRWVLE
jgi:hypothetical protein